MIKHKVSNEELVKRLNAALGWELRAMLMYAHFAEYVTGIHRLQLKTYFEGEATESFDHARIVRAAISVLGGVAVTNRDETPIEHLTDYRVMLEQSLVTERRAAEGYAAILEALDDDSDLYDDMQQIYFAELRSVAEMEQLLG